MEPFGSASPTQSFDFGEIASAIYFSAPVTFLCIFLLVYIVVLVIDLILLLLNSDLRKNIRRNVVGANIAITRPSKVKKSFEKIARRLETQSPTQYKIAVLEADKLVDEVLSGIGYKGRNIGERLAGISPAQMEHYEELKDAHKLRNRIVHEAEFAPDRDTAKDALEKYRTVLAGLELL